MIVNRFMNFINGIVKPFLLPMAYERLARFYAIYYMVMRPQLRLGRYELKNLYVMATIVVVNPFLKLLFFILVVMVFSFFSYFSVTLSMQHHTVMFILLIKMISHC